MADKTFRTGPVAIGTGAGNVLNGVVTSLAGPTGITLTQPILNVKHIRVINKNTVGVDLSMFIGASAGSAAGTEYGWSGYTIPAKGFVELYPVNLRLESTDFLTALASVTTSLVAEVEGTVSFA